MKSWAPGSLFILLKIFESIVSIIQIWYSSVNKYKSSTGSDKKAVVAGTVIYLGTNRIINTDHIGRISQ